MSAAGKVCIGFSKPYVALYSNEGTTVTYASGQLLARGVDVSIEPETSDDNAFYADNIQAENDAGTFTGGTLKLTVDGLHLAAEKLIMGLPAPDSNGWTDYNDDQRIPYVGVGYVAKYMSGGEITYDATVIRKAVFNQIQTSHATSEDSVNYQTQALSARILRADDAKKTWKSVNEALATEAAAEAVIKTLFGISG